MTSSCGNSFTSYEMLNTQVLLEAGSENGLLFPLSFALFPIPFSFLPFLPEAMDKGGQLPLLVVT